MVDTHVATGSTNTTDGSLQKVTIPSTSQTEKSGSQWILQYQGSRSTSDLERHFGGNVDSFIGALSAAGASVIIAATLRPSERAYLMHYSWKIAHGVDPTSIPEKEGVDIDWAHRDSSGKPDIVAAKSAAQAMVGGYGLGGLNIAPALTSRHIEGNAIDMLITWDGTLSIVDVANKTVTITSSPRSGMNPDLATIGKGYGVVKFVGGDSDKPHWSNDGH